MVTLLGAAGMLLSTHAQADIATIPTTPGVTASQAYVPDFARLEAVSYRLSSASSDLCKSPQMLTGLLLHDLGGFSSETRPTAIRVYRLGFGFGVTHVLADSPAGRAGIEEGDEIVSVNGAEVTTFARKAIGRRASYARTEAFTQYLDAALQMGPATLAMRRGQTIVSVTLAQESGCGGKAIVQRQKTLNAFSDGRHVAVTTTMMRLLDSDAELAFVVAHEMAHNILHYAPKRNHRANVRALLPESHKGTRSAEIEADELAVELMARAGYDLDAPELFFGRATKVRRTGLSLTHPSNSKRVRMINAVIARIERDKSQKRLDAFRDRLRVPGMAFGLARIERGDMVFDGACFRATGAALGKPGVDRCDARAQCLDCLLRNNRDLEQRIFLHLDPIGQRGNTLRQFLATDRNYRLLQLMNWCGGCPLRPASFDAARADPAHEGGAYAFMHLTQTSSSCSSTCRDDGIDNQLSRECGVVLQPQCLTELRYPVQGNLAAEQRSSIARRYPANPLLISGSLVRAQVRPPNSLYISTY